MTYNFLNPSLGKICEKLIEHRAKIETEIINSDYNEKQFYLLKGKHSVIEDLIDIIVKEDLDIGG